MNTLQEQIINFQNYFNSVNKSITSLKKYYPGSVDLQEFVQMFKSVMTDLTKTINRMNTLTNRFALYHDMIKKNDVTMKVLLKSLFYTKEYNIMINSAINNTLYDYITKNVIHLPSARANLLNSFVNLISTLKVTYPTVARLEFNSDTGIVTIDPYPNPTSSLLDNIIMNETSPPIQQSKYETYTQPNFEEPELEYEWDNYNDDNLSMISMESDDAEKFKRELRELIDNTIEKLNDTSKEQYLDVIESTIHNKLETLIRESSVELNELRKEQQRLIESFELEREEMKKQFIDMETELTQQVLANQKKLDEVEKLRMDEFIEYENKLKNLEAKFIAEREEIEMCRRRLRSNRYGPYPYYRTVRY